MIVYGALSDTSIVQLFVAGIVPGLLGGFLAWSALQVLPKWFSGLFDASAFEGEGPIGAEHTMLPCHAKS